MFKAVIISSTSSTTKVDKGSNKEEWEVELEIQQRERRKEKERKLKQQELGKIVEELFIAINKKDESTIISIIVSWGIKYGFREEKWWELIVKQLESGSISCLTKMIMNTWLNQFKDCSSGLRKVRFKKIKYQFEKESYRETEEAVNQMIQRMRDEKRFNINN